MEAARLEVHLAHVDGGRVLEPLLQRGGAAPGPPSTARASGSSRRARSSCARSWNASASAAIVSGSRAATVHPGSTSQGATVAPGTRGRSSGISSPARPRSILSRSAGSSRTPANRSGSSRRRRVQHGTRRERVGEGQHLEAVQGARRALRLGVEACAGSRRCRPRNSMRTGVSRSGGKTSRIPPRRATCPGAETGSSRRYPPSSSASRRISGVSSSPLSIAMTRVSNRRGARMGRSRPAGEATSALSRPRRAACTAAARRRAASGCRAGRGTARGPGAGRASTAPGAPASWASVRRSSVTRSTRRSVLTTTSSGGPETSRGTSRRAGPARPWRATSPLRGQETARLRDLGMGGHAFRPRRRRPSAGMREDWARSRPADAGHHATSSTAPEELDAHDPSPRPPPPPRGRRSRPGPSPRP